MDLFHFSHDPTIEWLVPHVPVTNPGKPPLVWAIDAEHAPPVLVPTRLPQSDGLAAEPRRTGCVPTGVLHECRKGPRDRTPWLKTMQSTVLFRDRFDRSAFCPWTEASGQWITDVAVTDRGRAFR